MSEQSLKSRAIKTAYRLIECSEGRVDQNDILALGIFLGEVDKQEQFTGTPHEKINQAIHVLATTDVFLNNETLVYLGWEEDDGRLVYTFKTMPSQQKVILSFRTS